MLLIPAIDLKEGKCVRLRQGRMDDATVFSDDPVAMAVHWREQGGRRLHIVDLDGAFAGQPKNRELIHNMVQAMGDVPVQVGGGVRSLEIVEAYVEAGVAGVIVGTKAIEDPDFLAQAARQFPHQIIFGLDARNGLVATDGWDKTSTVTATELAQAAAELPLAGIVYTDIDRDGMMEGLNVPATFDLARDSGVPVIASGGVTTLDDLTELKAAFVDHPQLLIGAITGRAIYEGTLDVAAGQALFDVQPGD
ncbi:MAG: 1-(5-phosphoribosyl)-5-[(5-phosphoribosylamino)methylideneamino]imidazole-4-carboxamide isomerase [Pseudomonadota bacterium]